MNTMTTTARSLPQMGLPEGAGAFDRLLMLCVLVLAAFGLVMVYSVSSVRALETHGDGFYFLKRQGAYLVVGLGMLLVGLRTHPQTWRRAAYPMLAVALVLLVVVLIPGIGVQVGGARRWLRLGAVSLQPSEVAKLAVVLYLAHSITRKGEKMRQFAVGIVPHGFVLAVVAALLLAEPDLGTVLTLGLVAVAMLFAGGACLPHLLAIGATALPAVAYLIWDSPYRLRRILSFLDPWSAPHTDGFQIIQSFLAFGTGGLNGVGLGDSQQKLYFLPEAHTDFILAVVGEELGLVGVASVIAAYLFLIVRGIRAGLRAGETFSTLLATGLALLLGVEAFTNIAVVMGVFPTKGLTLPLLSFGGSSLVVSLWACGILLSVSARG